MKVINILSKQINASYIVLVFVSLFLCLSLYASDDTEMTFLQYNPSSITKALGGDLSGIADVWHSNPLVNWGNPAIPCFHDGIAVGITHVKIYKIIDFYGSNWNCDYYGSNLNIGYNGIGLSVPFINNNNNFGSTMYIEPAWGSYEHGVYTSGGYLDGNVQSYGISLNPIKAFSMARKSYFLEHFELAVGATYNKAKTNGEFFPFEFINPNYNINTSYTNVGLIAKYNNHDLSLFDFEVSFGSMIFNIENNKAVYSSDFNNNTYPIGQDFRNGFGISLELPINRVLGKDIDFNIPFNKIISCRGYAGANYSKELYEAMGLGVELGLLDLLYIRNGYYKNYGDGASGHTYGFGIRPYYKDIISFEVNYANNKDVYPELSGYNHAWDFMLLINIAPLISK